MARSLRALSFLVLCLALARGASAGAAPQPPTVTIASPTADAIVKLTLQVAGSFTGTGTITITVHVDDPNSTGVSATVVNTGYLATVTLPSEGTHAIIAKASNVDGSAFSDPVTVTGDGTRPVVVLTPDVVVTGDRTVTVTATVTDAHLDPNDPNALRVNGAQIPVTDPNTGTFRGKAPIAVGKRALSIVAQDEAGNFNDPNAPPVEVTRSEVCARPTQDTDNTVSDQPHFITVDRLDDRLLPEGFDPNANPNVACDIRPDRHPDDPNDPNDPTNVQPPFGRCPLRGALQLANAHPGPDVIALPAGMIKLTRRGEGDLRGDLDVTDDLLILGPGRDATMIDARKLHDRIFDVAPGVSFRINATTLRGGQTPKKSAETGGCVRVVGPRNTVPDDPNDPNDMQPSFVANLLAVVDCKSRAEGGGIALELQGPDDFSKVTCGIVARSSAKKDGGGMLVDGGALELRSSTIALSSSGGAGGALATRAGSLVMTNATLSGNKAKVAGGGLNLGSGASATLNNVTFAKNKAKRGASVATSGDAGELDVSNSILGDKPKKTCDTGTSLVSHGGNLDPGTSCGLSESSDLESTNPRLDKLSTNFGIPTHALRFDSPAIDLGVFATCEPLDERTADRVDGPPNDELDPPNPPEFDEDRCDSGAFEFASEAPPEPPAEKPAK